MKKKLYAILPVVGAVGSASGVMAAESGTANSAVVTAMTGVASDMTATGTAILPIALGVVGLVLVVRYGLKVFKTAAR